MKKSVNKQLNKQFNNQRQSRWLITGVTTMLLTVTAITNQTAYADEATVTPKPNQDESSQTVTASPLQQNSVNLKTEPTNSQAPTTPNSANNADTSSASESTQPASEQAAKSSTAPTSEAPANTATAPTSSTASSAAKESTSSEQPTQSAGTKSEAPATTATASQAQTESVQKITPENQLTTKQTAQPAMAPRARMAAAADESIDTWMPNKLLQQEVLRQLRAQNKDRTWNSAADITKDDMLLLKTYYGTDTYIDGKTDYSLAGLQYATNLTNVTLNKALNSNIPVHYYGDVADITPLAGLTKLTSVDIQDNRVTDISPLKNLVNLEKLTADFNHISDFSSLKDLTNLTTLSYGNQVVVNLDPIFIDKNNPNYTLPSQFRNKDGSTVILSGANGIAEPITFNSNNSQFSYKFYFNGAGAANTTQDGKGGLTFTGLQQQPISWWAGDANGQYNGATVVPVKDFYYMVGAYSVGTVYFAVVQAYELTDSAQPVTVKYQDADGNTLAPDQVLTGLIGEDYTAPSKSFTNYQLVNTSGNPTGTFTDAAQTVIFTYARMDAGDITFKFQDKNGNTLAPDQTVPGKGLLGLNFDIPAPAIQDYISPANATGTLTTESQTYIFVYTRKDAADVTIKYQDADGNTLAPDKVLSGKEQLNTAVADQTIDISNHTFDQVIGDQTFTDSAHDIIYVYKRSDAGDVTIKYQDENGNKLADNLNLSGQGKMGLEIPDQQLTFPGYTYKELQTRAIGIFTDQPQTIIYVYTRNAGQTVTVQYQDENGKALHDDIVLNGYEGDPYASEQLAIKGYTFKSVQGNANGLFTDKPQTITYVYTRTAGQAVTVQYQDENGKSLHDDVTLTGYEGDAYTTEQLAIDGYTFKTIQGNATGTFTDAPQTITYIYTRNNGKAVTVQYQDENGKTIHPDVTLNGFLGDTYQSDQLTIDGYTFKAVQGNAAGTFTDTPQTVTYIYTRNTGKAVTVQYQDENGKALHPNVILNGFLGDAYQSEQLAIDGYTFKAVQGNVTGTFTDEPQTVTYIYTRNNGKAVTVQYQDENGKTIHPETVLNGFLGDTYKTEQLVIDGYTFKAVQGNPTGTFSVDAQTVTYVYTQDQPVDPDTTGTVTVHYVTTDGKTLKTTTLSGNTGTAYQTTALTFDGYQLVTSPNNANGQFAEGNQDVTYVYKALPTTDGGDGDHVDPENPTTPEKPTEPEQPTNPEQPAQPEQPGKPGQITTVDRDQVTTPKTAVKPAKVQPAQAKATAQKDTTALPQTDEQASTLSLLWMGVLSLLATLVGLKKRKD